MQSTKGRRREIFIVRWFDGPNRNTRIMELPEIRFSSGSKITEVPAPRDIRVSPRSSIIQSNRSIKVSKVPRCPGILLTLGPLAICISMNRTAVETLDHVYHNSNSVSVITAISGIFLRNF